MANYEFNFEDGNEEYSGVEVVDPALETKPEQTVQVVELEETEGFIYIDLEEDENIVTDSESAFPAIGDANDELRHTLLTGRDLQDQHPVSAITGLREELNFIESLKTVYSDKRQVADYYQWEDTNYYDENRVGYFVTVCEDANTIEICDGTNVFGVTIDNAGFVGGQDDIARDISYGLVAHNGIVHVRCETDVSTGDYIISNQYGMAKKNAENYGFKVIGIEWVNGVKFAIVMLNLSVDQIDAIGENISNFSSRLKGVEENLLSAINLANQAYNKSVDAVNNADVAINTSNNISDNFENISLDVDNNNQLVQEAIETAIQAQTIANSTIATAETLKQEAVEAANNALAETIKIKNDVSETIEKIQTDVENSKLDIESAFENLDELKEDLEPLDSWTSDDGKESGIVGFVARANEDSSTLATLAEWKGETSNSIAGVIQTADANKASLDILAGFEYGNDQTLYPYTNTPKDDDPLKPIKGITFTDNGDKTIIANGTASDNADFYITQNLELSEGEYSVSGCAKNGGDTTYCIIVEVEKDDRHNEYFTDIGLIGGCRFNITDGDTVSIWIRIGEGQSVSNLEFKPCLQKIYSGISGLRNQVAKNGSSIDLLTSFDAGDGSGVAGLIAKVSDHDSTLSSIASWQTDTTNAISGVSSKADANAASITSLASWKDSTIQSIAGIQQKADDQAATIKNLSAFDTETSKNLASIEQKADANGASIQLLVANMSKYYVGEYSPAYRFDAEQAKDILEDGIVYVPTVAHKEDTYVSNGYNFSIKNYYVWSKTDGTWTENTNKVIFSSTLPSGTSYIYWYTNNTTVTTGYKPYTLYKFEKYTKEGETLINWVAVASLKNSSVDTAISQIRQNANSIETSVTTLDNKYAGTKTWVDNNKSAIANVVSWHGDNGSSLVSFMQNAGNNFASASQVAKIVDKNGNVNAASIVAAVNSSGSSVAINADKIVMTGTTTFLKPSDLSSSGTTTISGNRVRTGTIASNNYVYGQSGMAIDLSNGAIYSKNFSVNADGNVNIDGTIIATNGSIAGFTIGKSKYGYSKALYTTVQPDADNKKIQYEIGMKASSGEEDVAFYVRKTTDGWTKGSNGKPNAPATFYVRNDGKLYATNAEIAGKITSSSGTIGGWTIANGYLISNKGSTEKQMYLSSGNQSAAYWIRANNADGTMMFGVEKDTGTLYAKNATISGAITASSGNFANGVTIGGSSITTGDLRKLYRAARLGYNDSDSLQILRIDATSGKVGNWNITSAHLYCSSDTSQVFLDSTYLKVYTSSTWYNATWKQVAVAGKNSDARLKHNILNVESKYEELFNCLQPKTFGYTEKAQSGDPNHIHFGFIAQDILATEKQLNLDNLSFVFDNEGYYGLKMDEFIALNTWQIQKAKARISELEEKVAKLEKLINDK